MTGFAPLGSLPYGAVDLGETASEGRGAVTGTFTVAAVGRAIAHASGAIEGQAFVAAVGEVAVQGLADVLPLESVHWRLAGEQVQTTKGDGTVITVDLGSPRWIAELRSTALTLAQLADIQARLEALDGAVTPVRLVDPSRLYPAADPTGSILGSSTVTVLSVGSNGRSFAIEGLPAAYVLTRGDRIEVAIAGEERTELHEVVPATVTADGAGETAEFEVRPHVRYGMAAGDAVRLIKPGAMMRITAYDPDAVALTGRVTIMAEQDFGDG